MYTSSNDLGEFFWGGFPGIKMYLKTLEHIFKCWAVRGVLCIHLILFQSFLIYLVMNDVSAHGIPDYLAQTVLQAAFPCNPVRGLWKGFLLGWSDRVKPEWHAISLDLRMRLREKHSGMLGNYAEVSLRRYMYRSSLSQEKLSQKWFNSGCSWVIFLQEQPFCSGRKILYLCTLVISTWTATTLPGENKHLYVALFLCRHSVFPGRVTVLPWETLSVQMFILFLPE